MARKDYVCSCNGCRADVGKIKEFGYMVSKEVWSTAAPNDTHKMDYFLCIGCLEARIGRQLVPSDFPTEIPMNWSGMCLRSKRLLLRMGYQQP